MENFPLEKKMRWNYCQYLLEQINKRRNENLCNLNSSKLFSLDFKKCFFSVFWQFYSFWGKIDKSKVLQNRMVLDFLT